MPIASLYITTAYQIVFLKDELATLERVSQSNAIVSNLAILKDVNSRLNILNSPVDKSIKTNIHPIILAIFDTAKSFADKGTTLVRLTSFDFGPVVIKKGGVKTTSYVINVSGVAVSRDALLRFSKKLEANEMFADVDLPISNLVENKNPTFSIGLTLAKK